MCSGLHLDSLTVLQIFNTGALISELTHGMLDKEEHWANHVIIIKGGQKIIKSLSKFSIFEPPRSSGNYPNEI